MAFLPIHQLFLNCRPGENREVWVDGRALWGPRSAGCGPQVASGRRNWSRACTLTQPEGPQLTGTVEDGGWGEATMHPDQAWGCLKSCKEFSQATQGLLSGNEAGQGIQEPKLERIQWSRSECGGSSPACDSSSKGIGDFDWTLNIFRTFLVAQTVKCLPTMWETRVLSLDQEDLLKKEMATHSSTLAWKIPWMEGPGGLQSMGSQESDTTWWLNHQPPPS